MNEFTANFIVEKHLAAWTMHFFGNPAKFKRGSAENLILNAYRVKIPQNKKPDIKTIHNISVVLTGTPLKPLTSYNYIGRRGKAIFINHLNQLFVIDMWQSLLPVLTKKGGLNESINQWCKEREIPFESREAVRQKFYRMRKNYNEMGICLGKKYEKKNRKPKELR